MPQKILYIHHNPQLGGSPKSLLNLILGLDKSEFYPILLCPPGPAFDMFRAMGIDVRPAPASCFTHTVAGSYHGWRWLILGRELKSLPLHLRILSQTIQDENIQLVHLNDSGLIPAAILSKQLGVKVVWHIRRGIADGHWEIRKKLISSCFKRYADAVIAIDEPVGHTLNKVDNIVVIHNSIDVSQFTFSTEGRTKFRQEIGISNDTVCVGMVGWIHPAEGYSDFIKAAKIVKTRFANVKFLMVGGDPHPADFLKSFRGRLLKWMNIIESYEQDARRIVKSENISEYFEFAPFRKDVVNVYSGLDIVVLASRDGEIGRQGFEAAACGKPIISTSSIPNSKIVLHEVTGILVPPKKPDELAEAILRLANNAELRQKMGDAGLHHARENFNYKNQAEKVMLLYRQLLK